MGVGDCVIFSKSEVNQYLTKDESDMLFELLDKIDARQAERGLEKEYYICDKSAPYAKAVLSAIVKGEEEILKNKKREKKNLK